MLQILLQEEGSSYRIIFYIRNTVDVFFDNNENNL